MKRSPLGRKTPLKQTASLKRSVLKRTAPPEPRAAPLKRSKGLSPGKGRSARVKAQIARSAFSPSQFTDGRTTCARCGSRSRLQRHHIVERQEVERRGGDVYDPRNCLTVCERCHERHTSAIDRLPEGCLTIAHVEFAFGLLGDYADDYLAVRYPPG